MSNSVIKVYEDVRRVQVVQTEQQVIKTTATTFKINVVTGVINEYVSNSGYVHTQSVASATWIIVHNLGYYPNATVKDSSGNTVIGNVTYPSITTMVINYSTGISGKAYLS